MCKPKHLFVGTQKDNMLDASRKGRAGRPAKPHPKLNEMKKLKSKGLTNYRIAKILGIDHSTVRHHLAKD